MILTPDELVTLTARRRKSAQAAVLDALGVPYRLRPDNSIVVFRRDVEAPTARPQARAPQLRFATR
jgi:hypothetical protein